jgi:hypothetical protein
MFMSGKSLLRHRLTPVQIVAIKDGSLTFAFPPGQRVFLSAVQSSPSTDSVALVEAETEESNGNITPAGAGPNGTPELSGDAQLGSNQALEAGSSNKRKSETETDTEPPKRGGGRPRKIPKTLEKGDQVEASTEDISTAQIAVEINKAPSAEETVIPSVVIETHTESDQQVLANASETPPATAEDAHLQSSIAESKAEEVDEIIVSNIKGPNALGNKILEADGRVQEIPHGNAWKEFRAFRNNQDMGSLWEVRQAWFQRNK